MKILIIRCSVVLWLVTVGFLSCNSSGSEVDLFVFGATIYTMDKDSSIQNAMVIKDGKVLELGDIRTLKRKYKPKQTLDVTGKFIYPGLIDPHSHFYGLSQSMVTVDLRGVKSEEEMIQRVVNFNSPENGNSSGVTSSITGRGWDQNLWEVKEFPTNKKLNELFPHIPVCLTRIDGHAALVNQKALDLAGITIKSNVPGGEFIKNNGKLTGVLIDNAVDLVTNRLPKPSNEDIKNALKKAEKECFSYGLTSVSDAGVDKDIIDIYHDMHQSGELQIRIYAMANPSETTLNWLFENGPFKTEKLHVRSVKYYMDGAMGSRGACLLTDYSDQPGNKGFLLNSVDSLKALAIKVKDKNLQLNVHCIGDSANRITLKIMAEVLGNDSTSRWRIEHMQLISEQDLGYLSKFKIIPSMQPTHATSDATWVQDRLGPHRLTYAYAIKTGLEYSGCIALGTDFPVEEVNPFYTFYAATTRMHPVSGTTYPWLLNQKLSPYQTLQGMTIWAAYSQFEENDKGSLEKGKLADFIVMDEDLIHPNANVAKAKPIYVYLNGKLVASN